MTAQEMETRLARIEKDLEVLERWASRLHRALDNAPFVRSRFPKEDLQRLEQLRNEFQFYGKPK